jgi:hypothetical protein
MLHRVKVEPIRFSYHSEPLNVRAVHGSGFRYLCECGEKGRAVETWRQARIDGRAHIDEVGRDSHVR